MRSLLLVVVSFMFTILCWGLYIPVLHWGQHAMSLQAGGAARLRPFVCVGLAYFLIGVIVPAVLLKVKGEAGSWTTMGVVFSVIAGALGAAGALGIVMAIYFGGNPLYVAPLVFGTAPVVNAFVTIYLARRVREIGPLFLSGLIIVLLGAVTVLLFKPDSKPRESAPTAAQAAAANNADGATAPSNPVGSGFSRFVLMMLSIATTAVCWGSYGPTLHKGQAAMLNSRLRPFLCVGLAYFAMAVIVPNLLLTAIPENSAYNFKGTLWSLLGGAAGAGGALGIIMAFNFGGKPIYVMPLVYGGAPVVATLVATTADRAWGAIEPTFIAGLILVIAGSAMVLVFAPKGSPSHTPAPPPPPLDPPSNTDSAPTQTWQNPAEAGTQTWRKPSD